MEKKPKLPKRFKERWVRALRSGKYKQGRYSLYRPMEGSYCCLGVAVHMCGEPNKSIKDKGYINESISKDVLAKIPKAIQGENDLTNKLAGFNDGGEKSFKWIAAYIDRYL